MPMSSTPRPSCRYLKRATAPGDEEEERAQAEQRERVGGEDDERVGRDGEDRRDGVDGEDHVGERDRDQRGDRRLEPREPRAHAVHELRALVVLLPRAQDPPARPGEQGGERPGDPAVGLERLGAEEDEHGAQAERDQDAPEQHARLLVARDGERGEDQREDEDVVERERLLHHVAGEEGLAGPAAGDDPETRTEGDGEPDPDPAPDRGRADGHVLLRRPGLQVDDDHQGEEGEQAAPREGACGHGFGHGFGTSGWSSAISRRFLRPAWAAGPGCRGTVLTGTGLSGYFPSAASVIPGGGSPCGRGERQRRRRA